jgi:ketosteroid isomerase-like protein
VTFDISDVAVATNGTLGYGHSIQHLSGMSADGKPISITVRVTDDYRKVGGKWYIVQEHVSVPVDLATGKADLQSKP